MWHLSLVYGKTYYDKPSHRAERNPHHSNHNENNLLLLAWTHDLIPDVYYTETETHKYSQSIHNIERTILL